MHCGEADHSDHSAFLTARPFVVRSAECGVKVSGGDVKEWEEGWVSQMRAGSVGGCGSGSGIGSVAACEQQPKTQTHL